MININTIKEYKMNCLIIRQYQEKIYCKVYYAGCKLSSENKSTLKQQSAGNKVRQKIKRKQKGNDYDRTVE